MKVRLSLALMSLFSSPLALAKDQVPPFAPESYEKLLVPIPEEWVGALTLKRDFFDGGAIRIGDLGEGRLVGILRVDQETDGPEEKSLFYFFTKDNQRFFAINDGVAQLKNKIITSLISGYRKFEVPIKMNLSIGRHQFSLEAFCDSERCQHDSKTLIKNQDFTVYGLKEVVNDVVIEYKSGLKVLYNYVPYQAGCGHERSRLMPIEEVRSILRTKDISDDQLNKKLERKIPGSDFPLKFEIRKDGFGRYFEVHEGDGCGKPVLYFYPKEPTVVRVMLHPSIKPTHTIPIYQDYWEVLASPDGTLKDLRPHLTACDQIDASVFGNEYAKQACETNQYPYLYWSGNVDADYPQPKQGWIVARADLRKVLSSKLNELGLLPQERNDMLDYWVPYLEAKSAPYYRVSFILTEELNRFFRMVVKPKPDTLIRVFLDWSALAERPKVEPQPLVLKRIKRDGFTVVEWGGLKK